MDFTQVGTTENAFVWLIEYFHHAPKISKNLLKKNIFKHQIVSHLTCIYRYWSMTLLL